MSFTRLLKVSVAAVMTLALASCGGGGGGGGGAPQLTNMGGALQGRALALTNSVTSFAGTAGSADGAAGRARFSLPSDVACDGTNLYVVDTGNSVVRKVVLATGATSTVAGLAGVTGSADGAGAAARFNYPTGIAMSSDNSTLYVSDTGNNTIRSIDVATGAVTTLAGTAGSVGSANGTGGAARFSSPCGVATDGTNLYVADSLNHRIRKIVLASAAVTTLAGSGVQDFADGTGAAASFNSPRGIATDGTSLYLADQGNSAVRRIVIATGVVSTLVQPAAGIESPAGIATDGTNLYVADTEMNNLRKVVIATHAVSTLAGDVAGAPGSNNASGGAARFSTPGGLAFNGGALYVADAGNDLLRKVTVATGDSSTVAGVVGSADGVGVAAAFTSPYDLTTDGRNVYVADSNNHTIRQISIATGAVTTLAGTADRPGSVDATGAAASFRFPSGITTDGTSIFVSDTGNNTIRKIVIATGAVSTLAGTAGVTGAADGSGSAASFHSPNGITTDGTNLYVADSGNNSVRKIVIATGAVTTVVAPSAGLSSPYGITTDGATLYITDSGNDRICKLVLATSVFSPLTVSGVAFNFPSGITTDGVSLFVTDAANGSVSRIAIATGVSGAVLTGLRNPNGISTDGTTLYVADAHDNTVIRVR
ncbi:hypothetical protein M1B72_11470 [Geomonas paludis]|uniref:SMP-30/Gluconolactonase/LRE-like region domain-containing protein n=1 Tax=Geomonas paludis TaxID=2740185 RepID=A0A6V8MZQ8_9BACT|nr:hypothetical protein [Geomonas paludis]UPU34073.1 hypothetical protein M1B72_11470 [Geomonas paludis]GFO65652.1 hypothetical protein GMPD_35710 [Geomonas paludis]